MEMVAVINGLKAIPKSTSVTVFTDSQYVVNTMTRRWKRRANKDLWKILDEEVHKRNVLWEWVRGHSGNIQNEQADALASQEAEMPVSDTDTGRLTHINELGKASMVDIGHKLDTKRVAVATGSVRMRSETLELIMTNGFEKGDILAVARVAAIMGAKNTSQLIPLCHPLPIDQVSVEFELDKEQKALLITVTVKTNARTGVEMEALTAVSIAALTIYDMGKSVDRAMRIDGVRLVRKIGGKSGDIVLE
jgi:cyclic pyranopterin phosphate synthase